MKEAGSFTFTFLSDESFEVIDYVQMKNEEQNMSYRGISILDKEGNYVYHHVNDHWGEQIETTSDLIHEQFEEMNQ